MRKKLTDVTIFLIIVKETHSVNANLIIKNVKSIIIRKKMEII